MLVLIESDEVCYNTADFVNHFSREQDAFKLIVNLEATLRIVCVFQISSL